MKKQKKSTEIVFILDKSGSMSGLEEDTIGGFNSMLKKQKKQEGECVVTTVLFDSDNSVIHDRIKLSDVPDMTEDDYVTGGSTALLDTIGQTIEHIERIQKYIRKEDIPEQTVFVITTDGMENASRKYSKSTIKWMIEDKKERYGWEFIFIGANIDAVQTASGLGIDKSRSANYVASSKGTGFMYDTVSDAIFDMREDGEFDCEYMDILNIFTQKEK